MLAILDIATRFLAFLTNELVPFFTEVPESIDFPYITFDVDTLTFALATGSIPWFFGNVSFGEWLLMAGFIGLLGYRFVKFMLDIFF